MATPQIPVRPTWDWDNKAGPKLEPTGSWSHAPPRLTADFEYLGERFKSSRTLADPFPEADPLPGAYRLHLPSEGLTIWYTVTERPDGQVVIVVQYVKADT